MSKDIVNAGAKADSHQAVISRIDGEKNALSLIEMALSGGADISVIERMVDLQNQQEERRAKKLFNISMSKFQGELPVIEKNGVVDFTSTKGRTYYRYARIEDIAQAIKPALVNNGLSYRFTQTVRENLITVGCFVSHEAGHFEYTEFSGFIDTSGGKDNLKGSASTVSYLRRYTLTGALGIVVGGEDDEGFGANQQQEQPVDVNIYPDAEFDKNFPLWAKKIESGQHTADSLHSFLSKKKIIISQNQYDKLASVKPKTAGN